MLVEQYLEAHGEGAPPAKELRAMARLAVPPSYWSVDGLSVRQNSVTP